MNNQAFYLQPFASTKPLPDLKITGNIARNHNQLAISYTLVGDLNKILIAQPSDIPKRKHELWQETCFEFFLGIKGSLKYWEFNLSPSGDWNVYRFDDYRQGMEEEKAFTTFPFSVKNQSNVLNLALDVDLNKIVSAEKTLEIAIATVIKNTESEITYWALTHPGVEADFHRRDSFIIEL